MRVDAPRHGEHCGLRPQPDGPQAAHIGSVLTGPRQLHEERAQRHGAGLQYSRVHVGMTAAVDVANQTGLGPCRQLAQQRENRLVGDQLHNKAAFTPLRRMGGRYCELGRRAHTCCPTLHKDEMSRSRTPSIDFASTPARPPVRCSFQSSR
jgi:hypothetical protein